jgi:hypothetical protein
MKIMASIGKDLVLVSCLAATVGGFASGTHAKHPTVIESVRGFSNWKKANSAPVRLTTYLDGLCMPASPKRIDAAKAANPHLDRFIQVYVNPVGEKAMTKGGTFPVGSVIVKEKHNGDKGPALLSTVMIKREKGFNPTCGDWEFASLDASGQKITSQGKLEFCMKCHQDVPKKDFVFRSYVGMKKGEHRSSAATVRLWDQGN